MATNLNLIDPNQVISDLPDYLNGSPDYEKMYIFVELVASRQKRTVLRSDAPGIAGTTKLFNGLDEEVTISMMGYNQEGAVNQHTSKYIFNTSISDKPYEGFGINNIRISTNASYIPKVTIDFIDTRGSSFAQTKDSIYNILFDFPPPIYNLTLKGYYGRGLSYELHLLKYNIKFSSDNGSYLISADFVARTFAPLTDVLFKYVEMFPLINKGTQEPPTPPTFPDADDEINVEGTADSDNRFKPKNTRGLIRKLETLYDKINEAKNTSVESKELEEIRNENTVLRNFNIKLNNFTETFPINGEIKETGVFIIHNVKKEDQQPNIRIAKLKDYATFLSTKGTQTIDPKISKRLYLGFELGKTVLKSHSFSAQDRTQISKNLYEIRNLMIDGTKQVNKIFNDRITKDIITPTIIKKQDEETYAAGNTIADEATKIVYQYIDITNFYQALNLRLTQTSKDIKIKEDNLLGLINETVYNELGMRPTIYNIFKVICDDVDLFFNAIKTTSVDAEKHHAIHEKKIVKRGENGIKDFDVTAFPLYVSAETVCNIVRQARRMPTKKAIGYENGMDEFPEAQLVWDFMDAFIDLAKKELAEEMKTQKDAQGYSKWLPVNPADTTLFKPGFDESPYYNLYDGKKSNEKIYTILLNRFYSQSQYSYGIDFFAERGTKKNPNDGSDGSVSSNKDALVNYLAEAEAVNIAQSIVEENLINSLIHDTNIFDGESGYYKFIKYLNDNNIPNYSSLPNDEFIKLTNDTDQYRDRAKSGVDGKTGEWTGYTGIQIISPTNEAKIEDATRERAGKNASSDDTANPIDSFLFGDNEKTDETGGFTKFTDNVIGFFNSINIFNDKELKVSSEGQIKSFSEQNIPIQPDVAAGENLTSRYILEDVYDGFIKQGNWNEYNRTVKKYNGSNADAVIKEAAEFVDEEMSNDSYLTIKGSFIDTWSFILSRYSEGSYNFFTGDTYSNELKAFIIVSNFYKTIGYFNTYTSVNKIFKNPTLVDLPYYSALYMGGLVKIFKEPTLRNELMKFYNTDYGKDLRRHTKLPSLTMSYTLYDLYKIELLSNNDRLEFELFFDEYFKSPSLYSQNLTEIINMIEVVEEEIKEEFEIEYPKLEYEKNYNNVLVLNKKEEKYKEFLHPTSESGIFKGITNTLNDKTVILNFSQFTFDDNPNAVPTTYTTLSELNKSENQTVQNAIKRYFKTFFAKLAKEIKKRDKELTNLEAKYKSNINDYDIATQTYYSFKNINDKWVAGHHNQQVYGFPYNKNNTDRLINKFAFVDRAMNPIGDDVIINAEPLIEMIQDYDLSVFTVFSRLLSHNNFEFFPLQNFMSYEENEWKESFKINETVQDQLATPAFVCMYIGGTSSFPNNKSSDYQDDGLDLNNLTDVDDFTSVPCSEVSEVVNKPAIDAAGKKIFPYSQVRAFRVRYGEQNQSIFKNIDIDSREYPDTNESLAILSKIAQDKSTSSPVAKAQNLYNTFETRAYSAKISMMGNVMIQPTQYFQLENIPIFSGAYVILDVEHVIQPNNMETTFTGVKVLKFPNPFVKEYATVVGINSGTSQDLSGNDRHKPAPVESVYGDAGAATLPKTAQHNSMYNLLIKPITRDQESE